MSKFKSVLVNKNVVTDVNFITCCCNWFLAHSLFKFLKIFKRKMSVCLQSFVNIPSSNHALKYISEKKMKIFFSTWQPFSLINIYSNKRKVVKGKEKNQLI